MASHSSMTLGKAANMLPRHSAWHTACLLLLYSICAVLPATAWAASCITQSQMKANERDNLSTAARAMVDEVQKGNVQALRGSTIPSLAADFGGIESSANGLKPLVQRATITIDSMYVLDASTETSGAVRTDFYCGTPLVVVNLTNLPPGRYALTILHATGVAQPQQISLILVETADDHWMLGGFFSKPMVQAGHDGLWYWSAARKYEQANMKLDAWLYYRMAADILEPVDFISSPNLERIQHEVDSARPDHFSDTEPLMLDAQGSAFKVTIISTTTVFGSLDLEVHYAPDAAQAALLHDPPNARKQVTQVMTALLALHPELHDAFHGIWVQADQGSDSVFSLELPMDQITGNTMLLPATASNSGAR